MGHVLIPLMPEEPPAVSIHENVPGLQVTLVRLWPTAEPNYRPAAMDQWALLNDLSLKFSIKGFIYLKCFDS